MHLRSIGLLALLAVSTSALAVPNSFSHQGRLFDSAGAPIDATTPITFSVYDVATGGTALWSSAESVVVDNGYYAIELSGLDVDDFNGDDRWLGIKVDAGAELTRIPMDSVPYAFRAQDAFNVKGGSVDAESITVNSKTIVNSAGDMVAPVSWDVLTSLPTEITSVLGGDTLSGLTCAADGDIAYYGSAGWTCAAPDYAATAHTHDLSNYYTKTEVDNLKPGGVPQAWQSTGTTDACGPASGYEVIPDMELNFDLDGDYVVLVEIDYTTNGGNGDMIATRLNVDGAEDPSWTHSQPQGSGGEDDHMHLFRIEALGAGAHTVSAEWGDMSGSVCNNSGNGNPVWTRRISAYAIPIETGVEFGYKHGASGDACHSASGATWTTVGDMTMPMDLSEDSVVLSMFDYTTVGASGSWTGTRLAVDGVSDGGTHTQPIGGASEDDHHWIFQQNNLDAGSHTLTGEWGQGGVSICNTMSANKYTDRRIGWIALPKSSGVISAYANPKSNGTTSSGTYTTAPGLSYDLWMPLQNDYLAHSSASLNWYPSASGNWGSTRFNVDLLGELRGTHVQPSTSGEDDLVGTNRIDLFSPGQHRISYEWRAGGGTMTGDSSNASSIWHRRMGTFALPVKSYR